MKSKNFIIPLVVYPFDVMVSIGETDEQLKKVFKKYDIPVLDYFEHRVTKGRCSFLVGNQSLLRFRTYQDADHETIAHEIFHAVSNIMCFINMPLKNGDNDEAWAYLIGYITQEFYKYL